MQIYLMRHGKALYGKEDKDLTTDGIKETKATAILLKEKSVTIDKIIHSGKARARETAEIVSDTLDEKIPVTYAENLNPNDEVKKTAELLDKSENLMIVSHIPFLPDLISYLVTGSPENSITAFGNSEIICMEFKDKKWDIKWKINSN